MLRKLLADEIRLGNEGGDWGSFCTDEPSLAPIMYVQPYASRKYPFWDDWFNSGGFFNPFTSAGCNGMTNRLVVPMTEPLCYSYSAQDHNTHRLIPIYNVSWLLPREWVKPFTLTGCISFSEQNKGNRTFQSAGEAVPVYYGRIIEQSSLLD